MQLLFIAALLLATGCAPMADVQAQEGVGRLHGGFYNRPGATQQDLMSELDRCRSIATGLDGSTVEQRPLTSVPGNVSGNPVGVTEARATIEDCMVTRGWRLFTMTAREGAEFNAMSANARARELMELVGSSHPKRGRLVRANDRLLLQRH